MRPGARIRHENLEILVGEAGSAAALARRTGTSDSYLSQVRNHTPALSGKPRGIGDRLAGKLERGMGKPPGWLDEPHGAAPVDRDTSPSGGAGQPDDDRLPGGSRCPLLSWMQAGQATPEPAPAEAHVRLTCPVSCSPGTFVLRVKDESMAPKFHDGELIYVDPNAPADAGRYVVVCTDSAAEATFKQLVEADGHRYLRALNADWPKPVVEARESVRICGVVVFHGGRV